jgi:drug/metabolite transporter (DMT)-like permease
MQRELTGKLGTVGATHVRFLFGFPFVIVFLLGVMLATGASLPRPGLSFWPWAILGAFAQVAATALMLAAMGERSFVFTIAYIKTEPIQVAVFGLLFLGDTVTVPMTTAIIVATSGVVIMSTKPGGMIGGIRPTLIGLASGGMFALSAIGFRGAILDLALPNYVMAATFTLAVGIAMQAVVLSSAAPRFCLRFSARGSLRCPRASPARSLRNSGSWPLRSPRPRACARWR